MAHARISDVREVRRLMRLGAPITEIVAFTALPRDVVVEIWWACKRFDFDAEAVDHVSNVLAAQTCRYPLVNGNIAR